MKKIPKPLDWSAALLFAALTILFLLLFNTNDRFFAWVFERHQNMLSWYIRPLFLIPFCFFAYKRSWAGISITIFALFTSMFWFNKPEVVSEQAVRFLQFEKEWLLEPANSNKILLLLSVPASFILLGLAFWKRSLWMGLGVIVLMAAGKITWSLLNAGESGKAILIPALIGLLVCTGLILIGWWRKKKAQAGRPL